MIGIIDTNKIINEFNDFFDRENISQTNRDLVLDYMDSMFIAIPRLAPGTIKRNVEYMQFVLTHIKTNLDKLTIRDVNTFKRVMLDWKRADGKPIAESTQTQYLVGFKRFMKWYDDTIDENSGYPKLSKQIKTRTPKSNKLPSDLLTTEEIEKIIMTADGERDKAIIATLAESGCRIGEITSCRVKDVDFSNNECHLTFPKGKTGSRTILLEFSAEYLNQWLRRHPYNDEPDAPLWVTKKLKNTGSKKDKKLECYAIEYDSMHGIVKRTAERAGIKKRVHPHLFRHTAATRLSKKLKEAEMKVYLGWASDSSMPATYIHLGGKDIDNAVRVMNGTAKVETKDEGGLKVIECRRCNSIVPAGAMYCLKCGLPLTKAAEQGYQSKKSEMLAMLAKHQDVFIEIMADFNK